jgi:hypothetical protein
MYNYRLTLAMLLMIIILANVRLTSTLVPKYSA